MTFDTALPTISPEATALMHEVLTDVLRFGAELPAKQLWSAVGIARGNGQDELAEAILDMIANRDGDSLKLADERALLAFNRGDHDSTLELLTDRYSRSPSATAAVAIAKFHLRTGSVAEASAISKDLMASHGSLVTVQQLAAEVAVAEGRIEDARGYYLGLVDDRPEHPPSLLSLAKLAVIECDLQSASAFYRRATNRTDEPLSALQSLNAAEIAEALGEGDAANRFRAVANEIQSLRTTMALNDIRDALASRGSTGVAPANLGPATPRATIQPRGRQLPREHTGQLHESDGLTEPDDPRVLSVLREHFGHEALRPGQSAVIEHELAGDDTLAIMPTGAGKSLTFQLPAMLVPGTTVVVSPLIALMKDQVDSLPKTVRDRTALINSTLSPDEMRMRLDQLSRGDLKLVYVAPERLRNYAFLRALREAGVSRVVVDEAHCISMWGHDFRPDYLFIPRAVAELGNPPVLAITATATPDMVEQIGAGLGRKMNLVRTSVFRPNLRYDVHHLGKKEEKLQRVVEICRQEKGTGIIYVSSRRDTESIAGLLRDRGVQAVPYHAGLDQAVRAQNQDLFMTGKVRVVVATVAFGMGINKADVRFIVHVVAPRSLEAYAQESGRAGRDGKPARCILLVSPHDRTQLMSNARGDELDLPALRRVYGGLMRAARGRWVIADPSIFRPADGSQEDTDARVALGILEQAKLIHRHPDAPLSYDLRRIRNEDRDIEPGLVKAWHQLEKKLPPTWNKTGACAIATAQVATESGLSPVEIDRIIQAHPAIASREGARNMCLHLQPVVGDATETLTHILERSRRDAETRINLVMEYANGNRCRHMAMAAHLGERLEPCGSMCDVCLGKADAPVARTGPRPTGQRLSPESAIDVLTAVRTAPFEIGKTGLVRLLMGSVESRIRADRSTSFGKLGGVQKAKVETLIEDLIAGGWLFRDESHEFRIISITAKGRNATSADFEHLNAPTPATSPQIAAGSTEGKLYERLVQWRRDKAAEEEVPAYVVATNNTLSNLAVSRPATENALLSVPGLGEKRVERYGAELLAVISQNRDSKG